MNRLSKLSTPVSNASALVALAFTGCDPKPSISVEPGSGLRDGQTVVVTLRDFAPHSTVTVRQCPVGADANDPHACGADGVPVKTNRDGRASVELTVKQLLSYLAPNSWFYSANCQYRGYCAISATGVRAADWAPLRFQDEIVPIVNAAPTSGLNGLHATITVTGRDLPPGAHVEFLQCLAGADQASGCQSVGSQSSFGDSYSGILTLGEQFMWGVCDAPGKCELRTIVNGLYELGRVPLSFDPGPTSHVTPTTDLADHQEVTARGIHIPEGATVDFLQCLLTDGAAACETLAQVGPVSGGSYATTLNVRRTLAAGSCEPPARCELRARIAGDEEFGAHALSFVPEPRIAVEPSTELSAIHGVTVNGKTFLSSSVEIYQCVAGQVETCRRIGDAASTDTGSFSLSAEVRQTYEGGVCDAPGKCELALYSSGRRQGSAALSFKPVGPLRLGTLEPFASVTAGDPVPLVGRDWASNTAVRLGVIPAASSTTFDYRIADASGSFSDALDVRGFLVRDVAAVWFPPGGGYFKDLRDCVSTPGSCVFIAHDFRASAPAIRIPLTVQRGAVTGTASIDPGMPLPYTGSSTAASVFIQGSGWAPNRALEVYQCEPQLRLCIASPAITTDAAGAFRVSSTVYYGAMHMSPESGIRFICDQPGSCVVVVADSRAGLDAAARIPVYFAAPTP